jgi:SAM-dependent methyltransferase
MVREMLRVIKRAVGRGIAFVFPSAWKHRSELRFWKNLIRGEYKGRLINDWYEPLYTEVYGLSREDYKGKRVLDIGCGPLGILEWADVTARRVGLDPLVPRYLKLGAARHKMEYVASRSENIPFPDGYFDFVTSLNSLDHVDNLDRTISEIKRVVKEGGCFLLSVEINHPPTSTEPITIDDLALRKFGPEFEVLSEFRVGTPQDHNGHRAVRMRCPAYVAGQPGFYVARYLRR